MKKSGLLTVVSALILIMLAISVPAATLVRADAPVWEKNGEQSAVTLTEKSNYVEVVGAADNAAKLKLSQAVNANGGFSFRYLFATSNDFDVSSTSRTDGRNYFKTVIAKGDKSIEIVSYAQYLAAHTAASQSAKMQHDIFYNDPSIQYEASKRYTKNGTLYLETIETFIDSDAQYHTVDAHKENGMWIFAVDGLSAIPVPSLNGLDLSDATVTFEIYSKTKAPKVRIYPMQTGVLKSYSDYDFVQFGSDEITKLPDDTVRFRIKDLRAKKYPGSLIRYREQLISAKTYDVREPVNIEFSYDVSNASAVWYAVGLGRPNVYDSIDRLRYNVFEYGTPTTENPDLRDDAYSDYGDGIASKNDGIMFQTTTGLAQPTLPSQNHRKEQYFTNSASKPYSDRGNMDLLTFIVKEDGTDLYHNGTLLFDNLATKLSDFASNGYMTTPYFHFFEDNASTAKGNTIVIKGVNAARRTDKTELKVIGGSNTDLAVNLDDNDNGSITLYNYNGEGQFVPLSESLYTYSTQDKKLTIKYGYFDGKDYDVYKLYARNNSGSEEILVRYSDPGLATLPPQAEFDTYYWKEGGGESDLVVKLDVKNGIFKSFSGAGITKSQWVFVEGEGDSTVGTVTIDKTFLNNKKSGTWTFTVRTTNVEEEEFVSTFIIIVNATGEPGDEPGDDEPGDDEPGDDDPGDDKPGDNNGKEGCGSVLYSVPGFALVFVAAAVVLKKKRTV